MNAMQEIVQFDPLKAEIATFVAPTRQIVVTDVQTNAVAADTLRQVKGFQKRIEEKRKEIVTPHNDFVKSVTAYARNIEAPLLEAEVDIKGKMRTFALEEERRRMAEQRRLDEERRELERKAAVERKALEDKEREKRQAMSAFGCAPPLVDQEAAQEKIRLEREVYAREDAVRRQERAVEAARPKNTRKVWKYEIQDDAAVPRPYLSVDTRKVQEAINAGVREIPGVRIYEETVVVAR